MTLGFVTLRGMTVGSRIKQAREAKGMSQDTLAKAVGVSRPAVSQWEDESAQPRNNKIPRIAAVLDVTPQWLTLGPAGEGLKAMPVKGEIAAGVWREAVELDLEPIPVAPVPDYPAAAQYGLLVRGSSMNKIAIDSEYVIVVDVLQSGISIRPGDIVCVRRKRHGTVEATAKRLVRDGKHYALRGESTDPQYQGIIPLGETDEETEIEIFAIVLGKYSTIKRGPA